MRYLGVFTLLAVLGTAMAFLPRDSSDGRIGGTWKVTSVHRDGKPDLSQVGARLTFMDNRVTFWPKALELKVFDSSGTEIDITNLPDHERSMLNAWLLANPSDAQTIFQPDKPQDMNVLS